jgi:5-methylcytosine-specific restriction endonuclease McrA
MPVLRRDPCAYCGAPHEHIDHIVPVAAGGTGNIDTLASACARCNYAKGTRDLLGFMASREPALLAPPIHPAL